MRRHVKKPLCLDLEVAKHSLHILYRWVVGRIERARKQLLEGVLRRSTHTLQLGAHVARDVVRCVRRAVAQLATAVGGNRQAVLILQLLVRGDHVAVGRRKMHVRNVRLHSLLLLVVICASATLVNLLLLEVGPEAVNTLAALPAWVAIAAKEADVVAVVEVELHVPLHKLTPTPGAVVRVTVVGIPVYAQPVPLAPIHLPLVATTVVIKQILGIRRQFIVPENIARAYGHSFEIGVLVTGRSGAFGGASVLVLPVGG
mmetsp:Transcript_10706/g.26602  ORF Transcript_10706/g.26602 Transcript_10706/m.26602 type:complete len:258 (-) Transcript_10706:770-1543(-)